MVDESPLSFGVELLERRLVSLLKGRVLQTEVGLVEINVLRASDAVVVEKPAVQNGQVSAQNVDQLPSANRRHR